MISSIEPSRERFGQGGFLIVCNLAAADATKSLQSCPDSVRPHRRQPTRFPHPWDSPGKNGGVGVCNLTERIFQGAQGRENPTSLRSWKPEVQLGQDSSSENEWLYTSGSEEVDRLTKLENWGGRVRGVPTPSSTAAAASSSFLIQPHQKPLVPFLKWIGKALLKHSNVVAPASPQRGWVSFTNVISTVF